MVGGSGGVGGAEASEGSDCIVVGHSSGGNAALRLAERRRVGSLIVIGAGNSTEDYAQDTAARELAASAGVDPDPDLVIVPFDFQAIVRNVTGSIVVVHGDGDDVIEGGSGQDLIIGGTGDDAGAIDSSLLLVSES